MRAGIAASGYVPPGFTGVSVRECSGSFGEYLATNGTEPMPTTAITLALWVKWAGTRPMEWASYATKGESYYLSDRDNDPTGQVQGTLATSGGYSFPGTGIALTTGWHFVVLRWQSGQAARIDVYNLDGTVYASGTSAAVTGTIEPTTDPLHIPARNWGGGSMPGRYARVFLHGGRLTDQQVETLRMGALPVTPTVGYWALDGAGASEVNAVSGGVPLSVAGGMTPVLDMDLNPTD